MSNRHLYKLKHVSFLGDETVITFNVDGVIKEKMALSSIDCFTAAFENDEELISYLILCGFMLEKGKFYIEYDIKQKNKILEVMYNNDLIKNIAQINEGNSVVKKDFNYAKFFNYFINAIREDDYLFEYLKDYYFLFPKLSEAVREYIVFSDYGMIENIDMARCKINRYLTHYKTIRDVEIGIRKYRERGCNEQIKEKTLNKKVVSKKRDKFEQLRLFD